MDLLDALDFVWNVEEHGWRLQRESLVTFKRQRQRSVWVGKMRRNHANNAIRQDRKELLELVWKVDTLGARSSAMDASGLVIGAVQTTGNCLVPSSQRNHEEESSLGNRLKDPSPNRKLQSICLVASGQMAADTKQRGDVTLSDASVEEDDGQDSNPSPVTASSAAPTDPAHKDVTCGKVPFGWTCAKLEPDWWQLTPCHASLRKQGGGLWIWGD
jgi:hypothetical protein